jgi:arylformamidase
MDADTLDPPTDQRGWIDISVPLHPGVVVWPGDPEFAFAWRHRLEQGAAANVSQLALGSHTGTHIDAPLHFIARGAPLDALPLEATVGPARVAPIEDRVSIQPDELRGLQLKRGERILFKTANSGRCWKEPRFVEDFVYITPAAARFLVECGVRTVGVDYLSVGGFHADGALTHQVLLEAGVWVIEGLNLEHVTPGAYELICLPLRVPAAEAAPARAILRPLRGRA